MCEYSQNLLSFVQPLPVNSPILILKRLVAMLNICHTNVAYFFNGYLSEG